MGRATPELQLNTLFVLDSQRRICSTREPQPSPAPAFVFIRGQTDCAWAIRSDISDSVASELDGLASQESPSSDWNQPLLHARQYEQILSGRIRSGPAFEFPDQLLPTSDAVLVHDETELSHHFVGWTKGEIDAGRAPVLAIHEHGHPVSICFCARRSNVAAEAGVETAIPFRGRGHAPRVVMAWAAAIRCEGLIPIYSTDWQNKSYLAVARKLALVPFATDFSPDYSATPARGGPPCGLIGFAKNS